MKKKPTSPKKITSGYLRNSGMFYLQRFPSSTANFRKIMTRKIDRSCRFHQNQSKDKCNKMLENLIEELTSANMLNDNAYAQAITTTLLKQGKSKRTIRYRLSLKGIDKTTIEKTLNEITEDDILTALRMCRRKKIGPFTRDRSTEHKISDKELSILARAGFSYETSRKALEMDEETAEELFMKEDRL